MNLTRSDKRKELVTVRLKKEMVKVSVPRGKRLGTSPWLVKRTEMSMGILASGDRREGLQNHWRI